MLRDIPTRVLLVLAFLAAGLAPLLTVAIVSYEASRSELKKQAFRQLESARTLKKEAIERFFRERGRDVSVLASDPYLRSAFTDLCAVYRAEGGAAGRRLAGHDHGRFDAPASYRAVHDRHFPYFSRYVEQRGYYDLLLLDAGTGETCFTVLKESDFAAAAEQRTSLGEVCHRTLEERHEVLSDTRPYPPSANAAAQFVAAPIEIAGRVIGVVALQISIDSIDEIMGERAGLGRTGDTYLVGPDGLLRSDSRLDPARTVGASFRGAVATSRLDVEAGRRALAGETGSAVLDERGARRVLAAWSPVELGGLRWAIVAAIGEDEIEAQIDRALNGKIALLLGASTLVSILLALLLSLGIARGIRAAVVEVESLSAAVLAGNLRARGDPDAVPRDLRGILGRVNDLVGALVRATDDKLRLEERMERMQRLEAIGTLAGGIAHDFNNIITSLFAYVDIAGETIPVASPTSHALSQIESGLQRAADLVTQILTFSRRLNARPCPMDLREATRAALQLVQVGLPPSVRVETDLPERRFMVLADPGQAHQVVVNLLINASQAMGEPGGVLTISLAEEQLAAGDPRVGPSLEPGAYVVLTVRDTGCGMDESTLTRVFEPFFTTKPVGQGTGMGLALVHGVVTGAGGSVLVESRPGEGSAFHVYLPRVEGAAAAECAAAAPAPGRGRHVLFVDDDERMCEVARQMLASIGYRVTTASGGRAAIEAFSAEPTAFDAVVTDLSMPDVSGLEVVAAVRAACPAVPVIISTAYPDRATPEHAQAALTAEVLSKPYRRTQLARALDRVLAAPVPPVPPPVTVPSRTADGGTSSVPSSASGPPRRS